jgi:hypothetical protein
MPPACRKPHAARHPRPDVMDFTAARLRLWTIAPYARGVAARSDTRVRMRATSVESRKHDRFHQRFGTAASGRVSSPCSAERATRRPFGRIEASLVVHEPDQPSGTPPLDLSCACAWPLGGPTRRDRQSVSWDTHGGACGVHVAPTAIRGPRHHTT